MIETHTQRNRETGTQLETKTGIQKDRNRERACPENVQGVRGTAPAKALGQEASCVTVMRLPAWVTGRFAGRLAPGFLARTGGKKELEVPRGGGLQAQQAVKGAYDRGRRSMGVEVRHL